MKKVYFILATAALVLASCENDQLLDQNTGVTDGSQPKEISFRPLSSTPKRAIKRTAGDTYQYAIDGTTFPTDLNMYVAAYQVDPTAKNYFDGTQFVYNNAGGAAGTSGYWGGATARFWPMYACHINFLAYANVTGTAAFNNTTPASEAVITQTDNHTAQTDLMYAVGNGEVAFDGSTFTFPTKVDMAFKHAQAWMDFYVKANSTTETAITINSITLTGAKYSGTYTITYSNYNVADGQTVSGAWTSPSSSGDYAVPGWSATALTASLVHVGKGLLIVPDDDASTADWTSFTINYTFNGENINYTYTPATAEAKSVEQGKHYIYNIEFKMHEIFVHATVTDWTDDPENITVQN